MTSTGWRPMGQAADEAAALYEGVQPWMERPVWSWITARVSSVSAGGRRTWKVYVVDEYDRLARSHYPWAGDFERYGVGAIRDRMMPDETLRFVDFLLFRGTAPEAASLERLLVESGSAWKVGTRDGHRGLERRVPLGVQEAAENTMSEAGHAGQRLSQAWHAAFGMNPDPSKAYGLAIKAVEDAAKHKVTPKDSDTTLGKINNVLRDQGWSLPLQRDDQRFSSADVLQAMSRALWAGQVDRHGGTDTPDTPPAEISQAAAETAVMLAVPLVQWFTSKAAARR